MAYKGTRWRGKHNGLTDISKGLIYRTFHGFSIIVLQGQLAVMTTFLHKGTRLSLTYEEQQSVSQTTNSARVNDHE